MEDKCKSYHTQNVTKFTYNRFTGDCDGSYTVQEGRCWGTKECEPCSCGGNRSKCDFYPEVRENGSESKDISAEKIDIETTETIRFTLEDTSVIIKFTADEIENLWLFFDTYYLTNFQDLFELDELDNPGYIECMAILYRKLEKAFEESKNASTSSKVSS